MRRRGTRRTALGATLAVAALCAAGCQTLSPGTMNPHWIPTSHTTASAGGSGRGEVVYVFEDGMLVERPKPSGKFRPQDVPKKWRHSQLAIDRPPKRLSIPTPAKAGKKGGVRTIGGASTSKQTKKIKNHSKR